MLASNNLALRESQQFSIDFFLCNIKIKSRSAQTCVPIQRTFTFAFAYLLLCLYYINTSLNTQTLCSAYLIISSENYIQKPQCYAKHYLFLFFLSLLIQPICRSSTSMLPSSSCSFFFFVRTFRNFVNHYVSRVVNSCMQKSRKQLRIKIKVRCAAFDRNKASAFKIFDSKFDGHCTVNKKDKKKKSASIRFGSSFVNNSLFEQSGKIYKKYGLMSSFWPSCQQQLFLKKTGHKSSLNQRDTCLKECF